MVSTIIPYDRNRGFLKEAIASAEKQSEIILEFSDGSVGYNVNQGIKKVKTEFVCILAEDDLLLPRSIENRLNAMGANQWIHSRAIQFYPDGREMPVGWVTPNPTLEEMLIHNRICGSTTLYRTELLRKHPWDVSLKTAEEYDFHLKLMHNGIMPGFCDKTTFKWRRHDGQKSLGNTSKEYQKIRLEIINGIRDKYR